MTRLIHEYVARQAERRPEAVALVLGDERLTYGQLEEESNRVARLLRETGCARGDRVAIFQPKNPAAIVSMLGTLKADCAYVPIDVASPAPRVAKIIDAAEPRVVLVDPSSAKLLDETLAETALAATPVVGTVGQGPLEGAHFASAFSPADWAGQDAAPVDCANGPDDIAHLLFTSGSTGTPKGVMIKHANVVAFVEWATSYFGTKEGDRISGHPPLHFDLSTFDIYGTFLAGAELHLVPASLNLIPQKLAEFIRSSELTQWFAVPSIFTFMAKFEAVEQDDFPTVERILWCGEVLPTPVLVHWMKRVPHAAFTNLYGPTEATIASSYYTMPGLPPSETEPIPIGVACEDEELLVLDAELQPVADGEIGDLYIAGIGLSPGYWRDEEKTAAAFLPDSRRRGRADLQDRRPGAAHVRRAVSLPRAGRLADQEPRVPDRARGDRDCAQLARRAGGIRSGRGGRRRLRGHGDLLRVCPRGRRGRPAHGCAQAAAEAAADVHAPQPLARARRCCRRTSTGRSTGAGCGSTSKPRPPMRRPPRWRRQWPPPK